MCACVCVTRARVCVCLCVCECERARTRLFTWVCLYVHACLRARAFCILCKNQTCYISPPQEKSRKGREATVFTFTSQSSRPKCECFLQSVKEHTRWGYKCVQLPAQATAENPRMLPFLEATLSLCAQHGPKWKCRSATRDATMSC